MICMLVMSLSVKGERILAKKKRYVRPIETKVEKKPNRFVKVINDKRIMLPIMIFLVLSVLALTVLLILESSGFLYDSSVDEVETEYEYLFDSCLPFLDGEIHESGDYQYRILTDGTIELYYYTEAWASSVTVPSEIDGYKVSVIGSECFLDMPSLATVIIPEGITGIGDKAFEGCGNLYNITIPASVTVIGTQAFYGCPAGMNVEYSGAITCVSVGKGNDYLLKAIERSKRTDTN